MTECAHPDPVSTLLWVWGPPNYGVKVLYCPECGALQPDASNSEVVSGNPREEESSPPTEE